MRAYLSRWLFLAVVFGRGAFLQAGNTMHGFVYEEGKKIPTFSFQRIEQSTPRGIKAHVVYRIIGGSVVFEVVVFYSANGKFIKSISKQYQVGETVKVFRENKKLFFIFKKGTLEEKTEIPWNKHFLITDRVNLFLKNHWNQLLEGKSLSVQYVVPHERDTYGFKFAYEGLMSFRGHKVHVISMQPSSIFVYLFVGSISLYYSYDLEKKFLGMKGVFPFLHKKNQTHDTFQGVLEIYSK